MNPAPRPQRQSLVIETANALRAAILGGQWRGHLPAERRLCEQWRISRPTLRAALHMAEREGLIEVSHGRPTRILPQARKSRARRPLTVGLLSPMPLHAMPPFVLLWLDELRGQLAAAGHLLQVHVGRAEFGSKNPARALASLIDSAPATVWILFQTTEAMQLWFESQRVPCVVVGSLFPGISLPAVDRDYRAICRHAVGLLASRGHRRIALLMHEPGFGGDRESEDGFREGLDSLRHRGVEGSLLYHNGTHSGIYACLDAALAARNRPTALLVARSGFALTATAHLLRRGIRIPADMAILCRDDDRFLDDMAPQISRYAVNPDAFAKQIFRLVTHLVRDGGVRGGPAMVMPVFAERESL